MDVNDVDFGLLCEYLYICDFFVFGTLIAQYALNGNDGRNIVSGVYFDCNSDE